LARIPAQIFGDAPPQALVLTRAEPGTPLAVTTVTFVALPTGSMIVTRLPVGRNPSGWKVH
jgi:hypothetical protein